MDSKSGSIARDFPTNGIIYMNNASVSLTPNSSIESMKNFLLEYSSMGPDSLASEVFINELFIRARKSVSKLIKCSPQEVIFTQSTTDGVNIVSNGLSLDSNSNIIIRGMEHEHHANYYPWLKLSKKIDLRSLNVDENGFFEINQLKNMIDKRTKLVSLSHALYNTGSILPVEEVGELLVKENIPYFLDTAQTVGCLGDYNFAKTKSNFMSFNGSKWLCGPMGIGIFYCSKNSSDLLEPVSIGGESAMVYDKTNLAYKDLPEKFQTGFRNYVGLVGMEASISYLLEYGLENIRNKNLRMSNLMRDELEKNSKIKVLGPKDDQLRTSIVSFVIDGLEPDIIVKKLEEEKIILAVREIYDKKIVRASPHFFNSEDEIHRVIDALKKL